MARKRVAPRVAFFLVYFAIVLLGVLGMLLGLVLWSFAGWLLGQISP